MRHPLARPRNTMHRWLWLLLVVIGGCGTAPEPAPEDAGGEPSAPAEPASTELLLASPPAGWTETAVLNTPVLRMAEYGPPGAAPEGVVAPSETVERVTFEAQRGAPLPDPIGFVLGVSRDLSERCDPYYDVNVSSGLENGYPTSVRLMICAEFRDSPQGQVVMAKAIQGNEQFYVITRRRTTGSIDDGTQPLTAQEMAEWTTYLNRIAVCDPGRDGHPCPADMGVTAPAAPAAQSDAAAPSRS